MTDTTGMAAEPSKTEVTVPSSGAAANKYTMSISLNVLNHLGINLYSNSVAVITETVANSWDADAALVAITIDAKTRSIKIEDDGIGMSVEEINARFLNIGYDRRKTSSPVTTKLRKVMGRKGLGKLSLFSIARSIKIYTKKVDGAINAFHIDVKAIEDHISGSRNNSFDYSPVEITEIPTEIIKSPSGTTIVLEDLKASRLTSESQLRARLARRFTVLGAANGFVVKVNGEDISVTERQYFKKLQYIWIFGDEPYANGILARCGTNLKRNVTADEPIDGTSGFKLRGWIGTVVQPRDLINDDAGNLNGIVLLARHRIIHENILDKFSDGRLYSKYLIGEIDADFLDDDALPDIATSSRQSLIEDDVRYTTLLAYIRAKLNDIANTWTDFRNEDGTDEAIRLYPKIDEWLATFKAKPDTKKAANKIISHIQSLPIEDESDRKELLKYGIISFEQLRLNDQMSKLDSLLTFDSKQFGAIVADVDEIEASLYHQIVKERISVIQKLDKLADDNVLEREIQLHVFEHLWLLDPSWERAAGSDVMEQSVVKEFGRITTLTPEEEAGRLDIRYKKSAGSHVIIELKRSERKNTALALYEQGAKYRNALVKCLAQANQSSPHIEVIFLVGDRPGESHPGEAQTLFSGINARFMTYRQIVHSALMSYSDYIEKNKQAGVIRQIISSM